MDTLAAAGSAADSHAARSLTWRYVIALMLVASLSTVAWLSLHWVIAEQQSTAAVVNISGRQRMLSQRAALFANLLANATAAERPALRSRLQETVALFEKSHQSLTQGDASLGLPAQMSSAVRDMYFVGSSAIDAQVAAYISASQRLLQTGDDLLRPGHPQLLQITAAASGELLTACSCTNKRAKPRWHGLSKPKPCSGCSRWPCWRSKQR